MTRKLHPTTKKWIYVAEINDGCTAEQKLSELTPSNTYTLKMHYFNPDRNSNLEFEVIIDGVKMELMSKVK